MSQFQSRILDARRQQRYLIFILLVVAFLVVFLTLFLLYKTALEEEKERLVEAAQSQARLMEAVARFDSEYSHNYPGGTEAATLSQFLEAHKRFKGFGQSGEFLLAREKDGHIEFLFSHRHTSMFMPQPIRIDSGTSPYLIRALRGESGTMIARDYRNEEVVVAYEPIDGLDFALVAKIDLAEVRAPFIKAGLISISLATVVLIIGILLFRKISGPLIDEILSNREKMRSLYLKLDATREEEKTRIAREVHDELGQILTALGIDLACLVEDIRDGKQVNPDEVQAMIHLVDATIDTVQRICTELRPQILDVCGLGEAIQFLVETHRRHGIDFDCSAVDAEVKVDGDRETTLFRIFQETLTNILRHAGADKVKIKLYNDQNTVHLEVEDNGKGLDLQKLEAPSSLGLHGMRERAAMWGGTVDFFLQSEGGTRVVIKIPVGNNGK